MAPIAVMIWRGPVVRADANTEWADVHADATGIGTDINLGCGRCYRADERESRYRKENSFHGYPPSPLLQVVNAADVRAVSFITIILGRRNIGSERA